MGGGSSLLIGDRRGRKTGIFASFQVPLGACRSCSFATLTRYALESPDGPCMPICAEVRLLHVVLWREPGALRIRMLGLPLCRGDMREDPERVMVPLPTWDLCFQLFL